MKVTFTAGLDMLGSCLKLGKQAVSHIKELGEQYEHDNFIYTHRSKHFKLVFQKAVEMLLQDRSPGENEQNERKQKEPKLVIYIKAPDKEKLKNYISQKLETRLWPFYHFFSQRYFSI